MSKVDLRLDWCSHAAAKYAVEHWHYSKIMPVSKSEFIGVWENERFIGALVFGWGANKSIASVFGMVQTQVCELTRVALAGHVSAVSRILSIAHRMIKLKNPGLRLIISYADPDEGHIGGIYQAAGWFYLGQIKTYHFMAGDVKLRPRAYTGHNYGNPKKRKPAGTVKVNSTKHKYCLPLDEETRKQIEPLRKPYPKRETRGQGEIDNAAQSNAQIGGASPT